MLLITNSVCRVAGSERRRLRLSPAAPVRPSHRATRPTRHFDVITSSRVATGLIVVHAKALNSAFSNVVLWCYTAQRLISELREENRCNRKYLIIIILTSIVTKSLKAYCTILHSFQEIIAFPKKLWNNSCCMFGFVRFEVVLCQLSLHRDDT